jgi:hypothetical protein
MINFISVRELVALSDRKRSQECLPREHSLPSSLRCLFWQRLCLPFARSCVRVGQVAAMPVVTLIPARLAQHLLISAHLRTTRIRGTGRVLPTIDYSFSPAYLLSAQNPFSSRKGFVYPGGNAAEVAVYCDNATNAAVEIGRKPDRKPDRKPREAHRVNVSLVA